MGKIKTLIITLLIVAALVFGAYRMGFLSRKIERMLEGMVDDGMKKVEEVTAGLKNE